VAAKKTFTEIITKYPDTDAAKEAQQLTADTK
jgi:TolA-binding protein